MKHSIASALCLGGNLEIKLDNNGELHPREFWDEFLDDAEKSFKIFEEYMGFDFHLDNDTFLFGIEPTYKFDPIYIIKFDFNDKSSSYVMRGTALGPWGSSVSSKTKYYGEYKKKSNFTKFVDRWFDVLKDKIFHYMDLGK